MSMTVEHTRSTSNRCFRDRCGIAILYCILYSKGDLSETDRDILVFFVEKIVLVQNTYLYNDVALVEICTKIMEVFHLNVPSVLIQCILHTLAILFFFLYQIPPSKQIIFNILNVWLESPSSQNSFYMSYVK